MIDPDGCAWIAGGLERFVEGHRRTATWSPSTRWRRSCGPRWPAGASPSSSCAGWTSGSPRCATTPAAPALDLRPDRTGGAVRFLPPLRRSGLRRLRRLRPSRDDHRRRPRDCRPAGPGWTAGPRRRATVSAVGVAGAPAADAAGALVPRGCGRAVDVQLGDHVVADLGGDPLSSDAASIRSWVAQAVDSASTVSSPSSSLIGRLCWAMSAPTTFSQAPKTVASAAGFCQPRAFISRSSTAPNSCGSRGSGPGPEYPRSRRRLVRPRRRRRRLAGRPARVLRSDRPGQLRPDASGAAGPPAASCPAAASRTGAGALRPARPAASLPRRGRPVRGWPPGIAGPGWPGTPGGRDRPPAVGPPAACGAIASAAVRGLRGSHGGSPPGEPAGQPARRTPPALTS